MANCNNEGNQPRKQKQRISWEMENYKKNPRNQVGVIDALALNKSGQVSKVSNVHTPTNGTFFGFAENSVKSIVSKGNEMAGTSVLKLVENNLNSSGSSKKRISSSSSDSSTNSEKNKMAGTRVLKRVEHKRNFPGYLGNRILDAKLAKMKKSLKMANSSCGKLNKSTKNNHKSSRSSTRRTSSDSDQGSNVPIPIHFKCGIVEYTKIAYSQALEKDMEDFKQSNNIFSNLSSSDSSTDSDQGIFPCRNCNQTRKSKSVLQRHELRCFVK